MTKKELKRKLEQACLSELLSETAGEDCLIYKGRWEVSDDICYIPDYTLNEIPYARKADAKEIQHIVENAYTGKDFLDSCGGDEKIAEALFDICRWQHPNIQDLADADSGFGTEELL